MTNANDVLEEMFVQSVESAAAEHDFKEEESIMLDEAMKKNIALKNLELSLHGEKIHLREVLDQCELSILTKEEAIKQQESEIEKYELFTPQSESLQKITLAYKEQLAEIKALSPDTLLLFDASDMVGYSKNSGEILSDIVELPVFKEAYSEAIYDFSDVSIDFGLYEDQTELENQTKEEFIEDGGEYIPVQTTEQMNQLLKKENAVVLPEIARPFIEEYAKHVRITNDWTFDEIGHEYEEYKANGVAFHMERAEMDTTYDQTRPELVERLMQGDIELSAVYDETVIQQLSPEAQHYWKSALSLPEELETTAREASEKQDLYSNQTELENQTKEEFIEDGGEYIPVQTTEQMNQLLKDENAVALPEIARPFIEEYAEHVPITNDWTFDEIGHEYEEYKANGVAFHMERAETDTTYDQTRPELVERLMQGDIELSAVYDEAVLQQLSPETQHYWKSALNLSEISEMNVERLVELKDQQRVVVSANLEMDGDTWFRELKVDYLKDVDQTVVSSYHTLLREVYPGGVHEEDHDYSEDKKYTFEGLNKEYFISTINLLNKSLDATTAEERNTIYREVENFVDVVEEKAHISLKNEWEFQSDRADIGNIAKEIAEKNKHTLTERMDRKEMDSEVDGNKERVLSLYSKHLQGSSLTYTEQSEIVQYDKANGSFEQMQLRLEAIDQLRSEGHELPLEELEEELCKTTGDETAMNQLITLEYYEMSKQEKTEKQEKQKTHTFSKGMTV